MANDGSAAPGNSGGASPGGSATPSAPAARPSNFRANVRSNVARAGETPAPVPGNGGGAATTGGMPAAGGVRALQPDDSVRGRHEAAARAEVESTNDLIPDAGEQPFEQEAEAQVDTGEDVDPWEAQIHGMTAREFIEAFKEGLIPQALMDKLAAEVEINGMKRKIGLHELPNHIMRQSDYSRQMAETKRQAQEAAQVKAHYERQAASRNAMYNQWLKGNEGRVDTKSFRRDMRRMGMGEVFVQAAKDFGTEMQGLIDPNPEITRLRHEARLRDEAAEDREWQEQQRRQQIQAEDQQRAQQRTTERYHAQLGELAPRAFEALQLNPKSPLTQRLFRETFHTHWDPNKGEDPTPELLLAVCTSVKEQLEDMALAHEAALRGQQPSNDNGKAVAPAPNGNGFRPQPPKLPTPGAQPLGPNRLAGAAAASAAAKNKGLAPRASNFKAHIKALNQRRGR